MLIASHVLPEHLNVVIELGASCNKQHLWPLGKALKYAVRQAPDRWLRPHIRSSVIHLG